MHAYAEKPLYAHRKEIIVFWKWKDADLEGVLRRSVGLVQGWVLLCGGRVAFIDLLCLCST